MDEITFLEEMTDLLDAEDDIMMNHEFADIEEWDSHCQLMFLSLCLRDAQKKLDPKKVKTAKTVRELYDLLQG